MAINPPNNKENYSNLLKKDLPDTDNELFQLHPLPLLDTKIMQELIADNWKALLILTTTAFLEELPEEINLIKTAHTHKDWDKISKLVHKMKGGCLYMGTKKLAIACQYLERYIKTGQTKLREKLYQQLLDVLDETMNTLRVWLQSHHE